MLDYLDWLRVQVRGSIFGFVIFLASLFFFFNDTAPSEFYTLSLHDALPIFAPLGSSFLIKIRMGSARLDPAALNERDRKSTRLNSSHVAISYAVFCLKKKTVCNHPPQRPSSPRSVSATFSSACADLDAWPSR